MTTPVHDRARPKPCAYVFEYGYEVGTGQGLVLYGQDVFGTLSGASACIWMVPGATGPSCESATRFWLNA